MTFPDREALICKLDEWGLGDYGAEIGVYKGQFSRHILSHWSGRLYLVDPWSWQEDYLDCLNCRDGEYSDRLKETEATLQRFSERYCIVRERSPKAADQFYDDGLDWVYIDGNHSYQAVKADIEAWWWKVREWGLMMGHDYFNGLADAGGGVIKVFGPDEQVDPRILTSFGVKAAVDEFVKRKGLKMFLTGENHHSKTWFFWRPFESRSMESGFDATEPPF
jgi:hypothetical protein